MCTQSRKSLSTKSYSCGDVIASDMKPFVHIVLNEYKSQFCDYCLNDENDSNRLKKCSKCHSMYYCNSNCQSKDWFIHKHECKIFVKHMTEIKKCGFMLDRMLLFRLIIVYKNYPNMFTEKYTLYDGQQRCFNELMSHENDMKRNQKQTGLIFSVIELLAKFNIRIKLEELWRLYGQLQTNSFGLFYYETENDINSYVIAYCVSIPISAFNHSCLPNACAVNNGLTTEVRAMTAIKPNEEICISYIDFESSKTERQSELNNYYFICNCVKCETISDRDFDYEKYHQLLAEYRYSLGGTNRTSVMNCVKLGEQALTLRKQLCQYYHPSHGVIMFVQLLQLINATYNYEVYPKKEFFDFVKLTDENLKITYGCDHKLYKKFSETVMG